jgi:hypothetical protein
MVMDKQDSMVENLGLTRATAIQIIEVFEDLLDQYGILIPDDDRTGAEGEAPIYGITYGNLENKICELLYEVIDE